MPHAPEMELSHARGHAFHVIDCVPRRDHPHNPRLEGGGSQREPTAHREPDQRGISRAKMVQHGCHRLLPIIGERQAVSPERRALPRPLEADDLVPATGEIFHRRVPLLDEGIESSMQEHGALLPGQGGNPHRGERGSPIRHQVPLEGLARERLAEELDKPVVEDLLVGILRVRVEFRCAAAERGVHEPILRKRPLAEPPHHALPLGEAPDVSPRFLHVLHAHVAERMPPIQLIVEQLPRVESMIADWEFELDHSVASISPVSRCRLYCKLSAMRFADDFLYPRTIRAILRRTGGCTRWILRDTNN